MRFWKLLSDLFVLSYGYWFAFLLRFDFSLPDHIKHSVLITWPYVILMEYVTLTWYGIPRFAWRFAGLWETRKIGYAVATSLLLLLTFRIAISPYLGIQSLTVIPLSVVGINSIVTFLLLTGMRITRRVFGEHRDRSRLLAASTHLVDPVRTLIIGAGEVGGLVLREVNKRPDLSLKIVGFLDDNKSLHGTTVQGVKVLGAIDDLAKFARLMRARKIIVAIANAPGRIMREFTLIASKYHLEVLTVPGLYQIVDGSIDFSRIRRVQIEDLLNRDPIQLNESLIGESIRNRTVLVTGAGGSIGSELCRQICNFKPKCLVLIERSENSLFQIHRELSDKFPSIDLRLSLSDVTDSLSISRIFTSTNPEIVFHAAAHKHVPMMEAHPNEALRNNVIGTQIVADISAQSNVVKFVLISTDKAVNPSSVMGASKRIAELYIQALSERTGIPFVAVRFGNVLGSAGSVVPIFSSQIEKGGPITVTHPEMTRYFMTIPEACQLVLQAGVMGKSGEIFILDMGEPVKIADLARDLISLSGLRPGEDIEIVFSGIRPGEKLFEELSVASEFAEKTQHPKIFVGKIPRRSWSNMVEIITEIKKLCDQPDANEIRFRIAKILPEYKPTILRESNTILSLQVDDTKKTLQSALA